MWIPACREEMWGAGEKVEAARVPLLSTPGPTGPERVVPTQRGPVAQDKVPLDLPASVPETSEMEPQPEEAQPEDAGRHTGRVHRSETL